jgi:hypothetical protein
MKLDLLVFERLMHLLELTDPTLTLMFYMLDISLPRSPIISYDMMISKDELKRAMRSVVIEIAEG